MVRNASKRWEPLVIALLDVMLEALWGYERSYTSSRDASFR